MVVYELKAKSDNGVQIFENFTSKTLIKLIKEQPETLVGMILKMEENINLSYQATTTTDYTNYNYHP
jgi:hypothetical protein